MNLYIFFKCWHYWHGIGIRSCSKFNHWSKNTLPTIEYFPVFFWVICVLWSALCVCVFWHFIPNETVVWFYSFSFIYIFYFNINEEYSFKYPKYKYQKKPKKDGKKVESRSRIMTAENETFSVILGKKSNNCNDTTLIINNNNSINKSNNINHMNGNEYADEKQLQHQQTNLNGKYALFGLFCQKNILLVIIIIIIMIMIMIIHLYLYIIYH